MKFVELKRNLQSSILNIYSLQGDDDFLHDSSIDLIEKQIFGSVLRNNLNKQSFSTDELDLEVFKKSLLTAPFFAEKKLVILKEYSGKIASEVIEFLKEYIVSPTESTILVLDLTTESQLINIVRTKCEVIDCNRLNNETLKKWISNKLKTTPKNNKVLNINNDAMELLISYTNSNLSKINNELDKLIAYADEIITSENVENLVPKDIEYSIFELTNSLANNNTFKAIQIKNDLMNNKKTMPQVMPLITAFFRRMFYSLITEDTDEAIAEKLKIKESAVRINRNQAKKFGAKKLKDIVELCSTLDYDIKSYKITIENATEYLISKIIAL